MAVRILPMTAALGGTPPAVNPQGSRSALLAQVLRQMQDQPNEVRTPLEGVARTADRTLQSYLLGKAARQDAADEEAKSMGYTEALAKAFDEANAPPLQGPMPDGSVVPTPSRDERFTRALMGNKYTAPLGAQLYSQMLLGKKPQETFTPIRDEQGNIIGQQSDLTGKVVADPRAPDLLSDAEFQQQVQLREAGRSTNTINVGPTGIDYGDPPKDMAWARNPDGNVALSADPATGFSRPVAVPVAGGKVERDAGSAAAAQETAQRQRENYARIVTQDIDRIVDLVNDATVPVTGVGSFMAAVPGTSARDVAGLLDTIKSNVGMDRLQQMRDASPTGGALGQVSEFENRLLQATIGNLEQSQSKDQFLTNLGRVKELYLDIIHGPGSRPNIEQPSSSPAASPLTPEEQAELEALERELGGR